MNYVCTVISKHVWSNRQFKTEIRYPIFTPPPPAPYPGLDPTPSSQFIIITYPSQNTLNTTIKTRWFVLKCPVDVKPNFKHEFREWRLEGSDWHKRHSSVVCRIPLSPYRLFQERWHAGVARVQLLLRNSALVWALSQHTDTTKNTKAWAVSQHTDTTKNTKAWAVSQHTDTTQNTKAWAVSQHTDTTKNTKAWAVSQHTDTTQNTKAWAVSQHTDTTKNTKAWAVSQHTDTTQNTRAT